jgi:hypothetical protein
MKNPRYITNNATKENTTNNFRKGFLIGLGPIVHDFPCISEELTDKST